MTTPMVCVPADQSRAGNGQLVAGEQKHQHRARRRRRRDERQEDIAHPAAEAGARNAGGFLQNRVHLAEGAVHGFQRHGQE